jgi:inner membrane protein
VEIEMLFRTHFVFAILLYLASWSFLNISLSDKIVFGIFLFIATIFVDIDSSRSKLGSYWIFRPIQLFFSHRGMIHSLLMAVVLSFILFVFDKNAGIGFLAGYILHLVLDIFTKRGVFLFWPLINKKIVLIGFGSGGLIEEILFVLVLLCDLFLGVKMILFF